MSEKKKINSFLGWFIIIVIAIVLLKVVLTTLGIVYSIVSTLLFWAFPIIGLFFVGYVFYYVFLKEKD